MPEIELPRTESHDVLSLSPTFYAGRGKRILDVVCASVALIGLAPFLVSIGFCIKIFCRGPIFYLQDRVGKNGCLFKIIKFRSMEAGADRTGPGITCAGDIRVTGIGKVLRRFKLDELPQLWNVVKGDMSLVGPRPELPSYVVNYSPSDRLVLRVRPGITDPASIAFRREETLLAEASDPEQFYRTTILPKKLMLNANYIEKISFRLDIFLMFKTIWKVVELR